MADEHPPAEFDPRAPGSAVARGEGELPGQTLVTAPHADGLADDGREVVPASAADAGGTPRTEPAAGPAGEAYLDIVWKQFRKNRLALWSLWSMVPVIAVAVFAPLLSSNQPFVYAVAGERTIYPWFRGLFNPTQTVDLVFNMAMVGFPIWVVAALVLNAVLRRRGWPGRTRVLLAGGLYPAIAVVLSAVILLPSLPVAGESFAGLRPDNSFFARSFPEEELAGRLAGKWVTSVYPPIPFGPDESNSIISNRPPSWWFDKSKPPTVAGADGPSPPVRTRSTDGTPHLLGTDMTGKDVLTKMIYGTRIAISVGVLAVGLYCLIGVVLGALAGYFGGWTDVLISRLIEIVIVFPTFFLILTLVALTDQQSVFLIMLVIGLTGWTTVARLIRGDVLKQRSMEYVLGARALGANPGRIIFRHILPNAFSTVLVTVPFGVGGAIILEANLSLLGFGVKVPNPSWGELLNQGRTNFQAWWLIVFPGLAIFATMTVFNLIGTGLRDAADPRLRGR